MIMHQTLTLLEISTENIFKLILIFCAMTLENLLADLILISLLSVHHLDLGYERVIAHDFVRDDVCERT